MKIAPIVLVVAIFCGLSGVSKAAFFEDEDARKAVLDLRSRMVEQEKKMGGLEPKVDLFDKKIAVVTERLDRLDRSQEANLELGGEIDSLKQEIAQLRGLLDVLAKDIADIKSVRSDLFEVQKTVGGLGSLDRSKEVDQIQQKLPKQVDIEGVRGFVTELETRSYEKAADLFRKESFAEAESAFADFLRTFPNSFYAQYALYGYANSAYATKNYSEAVFRYRSFVSNFVANPRVPDALLAMAVSQKEMGGNTYTQTLAQLKERFPTSEAAGVIHEYFPETQVISSPKNVKDVSEPSVKKKLPSSANKAIKK
jgi:TolA-binding protein